MNEKEKKRFISIRLTEAEFQKVQRLIASSACQSQTEYVKKILTNKPVVMKIRDQSKDDLLECLINLKTRLDLIEDKAADKACPQLLEEIRETRTIIQKIYVQCSHM
ncbi:hypothetical protein Q4E93_01550 [Flavitalea sp. BT771]|uniref:hypothetical protein n=1 Tax=Flavitalea sp. BT771 TaxID=3063329 RepID=UPI0026E33BFA|nr:hypothetical protein [Flavitalea sp. BT771]MDO6429252.1 hypothetical protein [Flavitalea sp. BT771]MDV6218620.1 hypothetical protein [Flavitalea sp. BT771]